MFVLANEPIMRKTKYIILSHLILLVLLTVSVAVGQDQTTLPLDIGFKFGVNRADVNEFATATNARTTYLGGLVLVVEETPRISYQLELLIIGKGFKRDGLATISSGFSGDTTVAVKLAQKIQYVELPMMVRLKILTGGKYHPYLIGGGYLALRLSESVQVERELSVVELDDEQAKESDFGVIFGVGIDIKAGQSSVIFESRMEIGMTKAYKNANSKNRLISFQFGYLW